MAEKIPKTTPVRAYPHPSDSRANIPTAELESFARPEEKRPATVRYPRDPTLDPQLVWKGKDEQDSSDLEVPAVPIYIQETIDPLALVEELRAESQGRQTEAQLGFFAPYTDLTFEEKVDFYRHPGKWSNRMILGDSLLVMTSLEVEIRGLDVYDPTTGDLRSSSVDDIAAWFLDTSYDGDAFFVRHAYFTGADDPYDKLRRALKADISDETWATINSTVSRPFPRPRTGKVAVKVINHYGDEVMKVLGV